MFGKIKDKLKNVFEKSEEIVEENPDEEVEIEEIVEEPIEIQEEGSNEEKKGFFSRIFKKKEEEKDDIEEDEVEELQDEMLEGVEEEEKEAIKKGKEVKDSKKKKKELEKKVEEEEKVEKKEIKEVKKEKKEKQSIVKEKEPKEVVKEDKKVEILEEVLEGKDPKDKVVEEETEVAVKEESVEEPEEEKPKEEKKGFLSKVFGKKEEIEEPTEEELIEEQEAKEEDIELPSKPEKIIEEPSETQEEKKEGFISKTFSKIKKKTITEEDFNKIWVELEIFLLEINIAFEIVQKIEQKLRETLIGNSFSRFDLSNAIRNVLIEEVEEVLIGREGDFLEDIKKNSKSGEPVKILILGVNGTGKTTTIAKIVSYLRSQSISLVVAASDTFRAAAVEQLEEHSKKLDFKLIQHKGGSDPAAVAYDAIEHARAKKLDVVLVDTAGRMPNNSNLMMELQKVRKVSEADMAIFVGDSISGNDLIEQIELFNMGVEINGVILTKVDTDEKPGSIVTTAYSIEKPIYFLGNGQNYEDLVKFDAKDIAQKLFETDGE